MIRKLVSQIVTDPLAWLWLGLVGWALVQAWRRQWRSVLLPLLVAAFLSVAGNSWLGNRLLASLETPYARAPGVLPRAADAVVMLGGQLEFSRHDLLGLEVYDASDRMITAAELVRRGLGRALVLGGGAKGPPGARTSEGELVRGWLASWGYTNTPIFVLGQCRTTRDEAERTRRLASEQGWQRLVLVTSALHMRRSEATFRKLGLNVESVACDFRGLAELEATEYVTPIPTSGGLEAIDMYLHEIVGWHVYRWRGWL